MNETQEASLLEKTIEVLPACGVKVLDAAAEGDEGWSTTSVRVECLKSSRAVAVECVHWVLVCEILNFLHFFHLHEVRNLHLFSESEGDQQAQLLMFEHRNEKKDHRPVRPTLPVVRLIESYGAQATPVICKDGVVIKIPNEAVTGRNVLTGESFTPKDVALLVSARMRCFNPTIHENDKGEIAINFEN